MVLSITAKSQKQTANSQKQTANSQQQTLTQKLQTMNEENIYDIIHKVYGKIPKRIKIMEEQIDVDTQMDYLDMSQQFRKDRSSIGDFKSLKERLYDEKVHDKEKKLILAQIANIEDVEAYREIERYSEIASDTLKSWAILALSESRMLVESFLLDEDQIIISSGLGGKNNKLRYFIVISGKSDDDFTPLQKSLLTKELEFTLTNNQCEIENLEFNNQYCILTTLVPIQIQINHVLTDIIDECNQINNNFLEKQFIITNMNILQIEEIKVLWKDLKKKKKKKKKGK